LFMKAAVVDIYENENDKIVADLRQKYDNILTAQHAEFEWKRNHDYAKNYIYLAQFYANSDIDPQKRQTLLNLQFQRASTYFLYALRSDPKQATTYWELGELRYTYARDYGELSWVDLDRAFDYYNQAVSLYTDTEVAQGWRGDPYLQMGKISVERAQEAKDPSAAAQQITIAKDYLTRAREEYKAAIPESRDYNQGHIDECENLLMEIEKDKWHDAPAAAAKL